MMTLQKPIRVALVEDDADQRATFFRLLQSAPALEAVGAFASSEEAETALPGLAPDVALVDIGLPGQSGIELVRALKPRLAATQFMMLTVVDDPKRVFEALAAGASGYLLKKTPPAKVIEAILELHSGGAPMSAQIARLVVGHFQQPPPASAADAILAPREREVLELLGQGLLYKEVADRLGISLSTVRTHVERIYGKLHVRNRVEALRKVGRV